MNASHPITFIEFLLSQYHAKYSTHVNLFNLPNKLHKACAVITPIMEIRTEVKSGTVQELDPELKSKSIYPWNLHINHNTKSNNYSKEKEQRPQTTAF